MNMEIQIQVEIICGVFYIQQHESDLSIWSCLL